LEGSCRGEVAGGSLGEEFGAEGELGEGQGGAVGVLDLRSAKADVDKKQS
jgi:hypothetical protein